MLCCYVRLQKWRTISHVYCACRWHALSLLAALILNQSANAWGNLRQLLVTVICGRGPTHRDIQIICRCCHFVHRFQRIQLLNRQNDALAHLPRCYWLLCVEVMEERAFRFDYLFATCCCLIFEEQRRSCLDDIVVIKVWLKLSGVSSHPKSRIKILASFKDGNRISISWVLFFTNTLMEWWVEFILLMRLCSCQDAWLPTTFLLRPGLRSSSL